MSNTSTIAVSPGPPDDAATLAAVREAVRGADALLARALVLVGRLAGSGAAERIEGLPLEHWLGLATGMTGVDRRNLVAAGEVLRHLPEVSRLFGDGVVSWGQVRAIVAEAKRLPIADRAILDAQIAATAEVPDPDGGLGAFDPDQIVWAVQTAVTDLKEKRAVERREERTAANNFLAVQGRFDGGSTGFWSLDAMTTAMVINALDAAAGPPRPDGHPSAGPAAYGVGRAGGADAAAAAPGGGESVDAGASGWTGTSRGRQLAGGLARMAAEWLAGGIGGRARPLFVVHVDAADATVNAAGIVEVNVRGALPTITSKALDEAAQDADVRMVLVAGNRPLAVSKKVRAKTVPADTRIAVRARDRGCRFPGSPDPAGHTEVHHTIERAVGGGHDPDTLVSLSRRHHRITHRHGWRLSLDPHSAVLTAKRRGRTWRSVPNGTRLRAADADRAPPGPANPRRQPRRRRLPMRPHRTTTSCPSDPALRPGRRRQRLTDLEPPTPARHTAVRGIGLP